MTDLENQLKVVVMVRNLKMALNTIDFTLPMAPKEILKVIKVSLESIGFVEKEQFPVHLMLIIPICLQVEKI